MDIFEVNVERALTWPNLYVDFLGFDGKRLKTVKRVNEFFSYHKALGTGKVWLRKYDKK